MTEDETIKHAAGEAARRVRELLSGYVGEPMTTEDAVALIPIGTPVTYGWAGPVVGEVTGVRVEGHAIVADITAEVAEYVTSGDLKLAIPHVRA